MINKATEFEMLRSLHTLWRGRRLTRVEVIDILKKQSIEIKLKKQ